MSLSYKQKQALHSAARNAGVNDEQRRVIQMNLGGFYSAADRTARREGFIACMAFYEARCGGRIHGNTEGYWKAEDAKANPVAPMLLKARKLAGLLGLTNIQIDQFVAGKHMSDGRYATLDELPAYWLRKVIDPQHAASAENRQPVSARHEDASRR